MSDETVRNLISYLQILQDGKIRPNMKGPGTVRDAKDNLGDIQIVKDKLNRIFELDLDKLEKYNTNE